MVDKDEDGALALRTDEFLAWDPWASGSYYALLSGAGRSAASTYENDLVMVVHADGGVAPNYVVPSPIVKWGQAGAGTNGGIVTWSIVGPNTPDGFGGTTVSMSTFGLDHVGLIKAAFDAWSAVANIKFVQVADNGGPATSQYVADIRFFAEYIDGLGDPVNGNTLALAFFPSSNGGVQDTLSGDIAIDSGDTFSAHEFFLTVLHEIGHSLGLDHVENVLAVMNPFLNPALSGLQADDINGIRYLYGQQSSDALAYVMPEIAGAQPLTILSGFAGAIYNGNSSANVISGSTLGETLYGNGGNDTIGAGFGNDYIDGGTGNDTFAGSLGDDTFVVDSASDMIIEVAGEGSDWLASATQALINAGLPANVENILLLGTLALNATGNSGNNSIVGNSGNNSLAGGDGNDFLNGGTGTDSLVGGIGDDTYVVDSTSDIVSEAANGGIDLVTSSTSSIVMSDHVENAQLLGSTSVYLNVTGNSLANTIIGDSSLNTLFGGDGDDILIASSQLNSATYHDVLDGGSGADTMYGSANGDYYYVDNVLDVIVEVGTVIDTVNSSVSYTLQSDLEWLYLLGTGNINATGNSGGNRLYGNSGSNIIDGAGGADYL